MKNKYKKIKKHIKKVILSIILSKESDNKRDLKGSIMGAIIGDAVGVNYELVPKKNKKEIYLEVGKFSDDSSMILCTMESLSNLKDYSSKDIADTFLKWLYEGYWTPQGIVLDCGRTTAYSLRHYKEKGVFAGDDSENSCGNGSLMRIMPVLFYINKNRDERFNIISEFSSITHPHIRCIIGCAIYSEIALNLLDGMDKIKAYNSMKKVILEKYSEYEEELKLYSRILNNNIYEYNENTFTGRGYIVDTLETSIYSFINSKNYVDSIKIAISFGEDTDTIACITGGLSGMYYGYDSIPKRYINKLDRKDDIIELLNKFDDIYKI